MANRINASVQPVQAAVAAALRDRRVAKTCVMKLSERNDAMLARGSCGDQVIPGAFLLHRWRKAPGGVDSPPCWRWCGGRRCKLRGIPGRPGALSFASASRPGPEAFPCNDLATHEGVNGSRRCPHCGDAGLRRVQAAQLPD